MLIPTITNPRMDMHCSLNQEDSSHGHCHQVWADTVCPGTQETLYRINKQHHGRTLVPRGHRNFKRAAYLPVKLPAQFFAFSETGRAGWLAEGGQMWCWGGHPFSDISGGCLFNFICARSKKISTFHSKSGQSAWKRERSDSDNWRLSNLYLLTWNVLPRLSALPQGYFKLHQFVKIYGIFSVLIISFQKTIKCKLLRSYLSLQVK